MKLRASIESLIKDIRYGLRQFIRTPLFTLIVVSSLGLGIGANVAIFNVINAALFQALPVPHPEQLVMVTDPNFGGVLVGIQTGQRSALSYQEFTQLRGQLKSMSAICAAEALLNRWPVRIAGTPQEDVRGRLVSEEYFSVFGLNPVLGRLFNARDASGPASDPYAVVSYDYWQHRFGGSPSVIGTHIELYGTTLTVIGVAPKNFHGETSGQYPDMWVPLMMEPLVKPNRNWLQDDSNKDLTKVMWLHAFGRLNPGVSKERAQTEVSVVFHNLLDAGYPVALSPDTRKDAMNQYLVVQFAGNGAFRGRDDFSRELMVLLIVAGLVLLIACANVANLLLARASARQREIGVRLSIGASRTRLIQQFLTESLLLSAFSGLAGLLIGIAGSRLLVTLLSDPKDPLQLLTPLDLHVFAFTLAVVFFTGLLFGLAPAIYSTRIDIKESLKSAGRGISGAGSRFGFAKMLVAAQVALSLLLLIGAGLFLRTLWNLQAVNIGYSKKNLLLMKVDGLSAGYKPELLNGVYQDVADRIKALPGVTELTYSANGLFTGSERNDPIEVEGYIPQHEADKAADFDETGPGYFKSLGIPLLAGREFGLQDNGNSALVCIINEAFAQHYFHSMNPIGRHVSDTYWENKKIVMEIVGIAANVHDHTLRTSVAPRFYIPVSQGIGGTPASIYFEVRSAGDPEMLVNPVRKAVAAMNPNLSITRSATIPDLIDQFNSQPRMIAQLCSVFGAIALSLAVIGLYGVLSYGVSRRIGEIGIRMALGADKSAVILMIMKETALIIVLGIAAGVAAAGATTQLLSAQLYGLSALDPLTIATGAGVLCLAGFCASYIPAARAARVHPMTALRQP